MNKDYYKILWIDISSTQDEIKKAYRKKAMKHHPDRWWNSEVFKEINEAFHFLTKSKNDNIKKRYSNSEDSFNNKKNNSKIKNNIFLKFFWFSWKINKYEFSTRFFLLFIIFIIFAVIFQKLDMNKSLLISYIIFIISIFSLIVRRNTDLTGTDKTLVLFIFPFVNIIFILMLFLIANIWIWKKT